MGDVREKMKIKNLVMRWGLGPTEFLVAPFGEGAVIEVRNIETNEVLDTVHFRMHVKYVVNELRNLGLVVRQNLDITPSWVQWLDPDERKLFRQKIKTYAAFVADPPDWLVDRIYEIAKEYHDSFCDYPCFTTYDVQQALPYFRFGEAIVLEDQGTTIKVPWGTFGNVSYDHFIESMNYAIKKIKTMGD